MVIILELGGNVDIFSVDYLYTLANSFLIPIHGGSINMPAKEILENYDMETYL